MTSKAIVAQIRKFASEEYPNEACGLIVTTGRKHRAVKCINGAKDKRSSFVIDPTSYVIAGELGDIVGVWHSHVEIPETPSEADVAGCESSELPWYIISVRRTDAGDTYSDVHVMQPTGATVDYFGRPYVFGSLDCYSLVRDYYKREFGVKLSDYPRVDLFWQKGLNYFGENWEREGFFQVIKEEPKVGDLFIILTVGKLPNHIAIYIGDDLILHHCEGRLSEKSVYAGFWRKHTVLHIRHKAC